MTGTYIFVELCANTRWNWTLLMTDVLIKNKHHYMRMKSNFEGECDLGPAV